MTTRLQADFTADEFTLPTRPMLIPHDPQDAMSVSSNQRPTVTRTDVSIFREKSSDAFCKVILHERTHQKRTFCIAAQESALNNNATTSFFKDAISLHRKHLPVFSRNRIPGNSVRRGYLLPDPSTGASD
jgi:hypothetical protein